MKKMALLLCSIALTSILYGQVLCGNGKTVVLSEDGKCNHNPYVLVFEDNFEGNSLDLTKWEPITGVPRDFNFMHQKAWHLPENIEVSNGTLKIITKKLATPYTGTWITDWSTNPPTTKTADFDYTTGEIWSKHKFGHGIFEIRCKLPKGKGFFPAFWTFAGNPYNEIDIFEFWNEETVGVYDPNKLSKIHKMNVWYEVDGDTLCCSNKYTGPDFSQSFHTFTVKWTPYKIEWYVDGNLKRVTPLFTTILGQTADCNGLYKNHSYIMNQIFPRDPMYIIANLAIQSGNNAPDSDTPFPSALEIDYIRFYQQMPCGSSLNITEVENLDLSPDIYNVIIGTSINLSGNVTVQSSQQLEVIATDKIALGPGFTAEAGSYFVARIDKDICNGIYKMAENSDESNPPTKLSDDEIRYSSSENALSAVEKLDCNVKIFPNPTKGKITIEFTMNPTGEHKVYLIDTQGTIIYSLTPIDSTNIEIDLTSYNSGTYFLNIIDTKDKNLYSHKIIKN